MKCSWYAAKQMIEGWWKIYQSLKTKDVGQRFKTFADTDTIPSSISRGLKISRGLPSDIVLSIINVQRFSYKSKSNESRVSPLQSILSTSDTVQQRDGACFKQLDRCALYMVHSPHGNPHFTMDAVHHLEWYLRDWRLISSHSSDGESKGSRWYRLSYWEFSWAYILPRVV